MAKYWCSKCEEHEEENTRLRQDANKWCIEATRFKRSLITANQCIESLEEVVRLPSNEWRLHVYQTKAELTAANQRIEELEGALKWTYVEEKLPPEDEELLILTKRGNPWIAEYHQELDEFFDPRCPDELTPTICKTSEVLAWQRIVPPDKHAHLIA